MNLWIARVQLIVIMGFSRHCANFRYAFINKVTRAKLLSEINENPL